MPFINSCLNLLWKALVIDFKWWLLSILFVKFFEYPILNIFLKKSFLSLLLILIFLFFINKFFESECQKLILFFANNFHGNFSPGSFFLSNAISECPMIFFLLIWNFFFKYFKSMIKLLIWKLETISFRYSCYWIPLDTSPEGASQVSTEQLQLSTGMSNGI